MELTKSQLRKLKTIDSWLKRVDVAVQKRQSEIQGLQQKRVELERLKQEVLKSGQ